MRAVGIILAGGKSSRLGLLTDNRVSSAIPIASSYRAIDFALSNMTNSAISKVAVITQYNSRSLTDHLASSKWWNFGRKQGGLFVFTPYLTNYNSLWFRGTADSIYQNLPFLEKSIEEYVVITNGDCIYKMDYNEIIDYHIEKDADITIICREQNENLSNYGVMSLDENDRVIEFDEKPLDPKYNTVSLAVYVIKRTLLIDLLNELNSEGRYDFVTDLIVRYRNRLKIYGYHYNKYWKSLNSIKNYYRVNMDFLNKETHSYFNKDDDFVFTKAKDLPPVKYNFSSVVKNCSIGNGSIISGSVMNSVLFRDVKVGERSTVSDSIIMENARIGENCILEYVIIDKDAVINDNVKLIGTLENPLIIGKATIVTA